MFEQTFKNIDGVLWKEEGCTTELDYTQQSSCLNQRSLEIQRLEDIYQQKLATRDELKRFILQKAFSGELTADTANQAAKPSQEVAVA